MRMPVILRMAVSSVETTFWRLMQENLRNLKFKEADVLRCLRRESDG